MASFRFQGGDMVPMLFTTTGLFGIVGVPVVALLMVTLFMLMAVRLMLLVTMASRR